MTMRAPIADLPIVLEDASLVARNVTIIDAVSLTLAAGAPTVVIGPNGAGKTTLLRLAMGLVRPSSGRVTWGGRADASPQRRAIVLQRPVMLRRSAAANIKYALASVGVGRPEWSARADELLTLVGLAGLLDPKLMARKEAEEKRLRDFLGGSPPPELKDAARAFDVIAKANKVRVETAVPMTLLEQGGAFNCDSFGIARTLLRAGASVNAGRTPCGG